MRRVPQLIPVRGSQPAGDMSHKPGGRLPLLSASAVNVTLSAFAAERRAAAPLLLGARAAGMWRASLSTERIKWFEGWKDGSINESLNQSGAIR